MLAQAVEAYLSVRRACGFKMRNQQRNLRHFAKFAGARGEHHVHAATAVEWASRAPSIKTRARRLGDVRRFVRYLQVEDSRHELPPAIFGSENHLRLSPYILSVEDIQRLVHASSQRGASPFRRQTFSTLFGLLACTGLRLSEAVNLRYTDVTPDGLVIRCTKFGKTRLVPLHETANAELERYLKHRRRRAAIDDHVFVLPQGRRLQTQTVQAEFRILVKKLGFPRGPGRRHPTPHSFRHSFAVHALQSCPDGRDRITQHMVALSTYLGHATVASTYWYLEATPELMTDISERCENFVRGQQS